MSAGCILRSKYGVVLLPSPARNDGQECVGSYLTATTQEIKVIRDVTGVLSRCQAITE